MIQDLLHSYGLYVLCVVFFLDDLGFFFPTITILFTSILYAQSTHAFPVWQIVLIAVVIPPLSNRILFEFGHRNGARWLVDHGYKFFLSHKRVEQCKTFMHRYGSKTIFLTSLVPTFRPFGAFIAGSLHMNGRLFSFFNIMGVIIMVAMVTVVASFWGDVFWFWMGPYWKYIILAIFVYSFLHTSIVILRSWISQKKTNM